MFVMHGLRRCRCIQHKTHENHEAIGVNAKWRIVDYLVADISTWTVWERGDGEREKWMGNWVDG